MTYGKWLRDHGTYNKYLEGHGTYGKLLGNHGLGPMVSGSGSHDLW